MELKEIASSFVELLGKKDNIVSIENCMTRIRVIVKDKSKVDKEKLSKVEGVMAVQEDDGYQIVVGPGRSRKIADILREDFGIKNVENLGDWEANKVKMKGNQSAFKMILKKIGSIFVPLIPAIIAAGLLNGVAGYFQNVYSMAKIPIPIWVTFMTTIGSGLFAYFAIYVGINAAKEFGATPGLGGILGAITISGNINVFSQAMGLFNKEIPLNSILTTGKGGVIGVIAGVAILAFIEKRVRKVMPDMLDTIVTPVVSIIVTAGITIFALMPAAGFVSDGIIWVLQSLIMTQGPLSIVSGFVLSVLFLPLVVVGLHHGLIPFYMVQLEKYQSIALYPILAMAGAGQVGAAVALYLRAKNNKSLRNIIAGALPVGILGVGEPLIYGVTLPLGKPFITACIGGGFGGAFCALFGVASIAFGPSGITAIPLIITSKIAFYVIGLLISYGAGFIVTSLFGIPKDINGA